MPNLEIEGRLVRKLDLQSGESARGRWERRDFVVEYEDGNFPVSVCFSAWGRDKVQELENVQEDDRVKVSFNIRGREYNGRWYNDLRAWRISPVGQERRPAAQNAAPYDMPASYDVPAPSTEDMPADFGDDLPF